MERTRISTLGTMQKKKVEIMDEDNEKRIIKKDIVRDFERQNANTLKETLCKELNIERDIDQDKAKEMIERQNSEKLCRKLDTKEDVGKVIRKDMLKPKENNTLEESLWRKLEVEEEIEQERLKPREIVNKERKNNNNDSLKEKENSDSVVKAKVVNNGWKIDNNDSLKEKINERLKSIERSIIYTQNDSLAELTKKIEIFNIPLDIDRKIALTILNTTKTSDNENNDKHTRDTICH